MPRKFIGGLLVALWLAGCGAAPAGTRTATLSTTMRAHAESDAYMAAAFNDAYHETAAENQVSTKASPVNTDKGFFRLVKNASTSLEGAFYDIEDLNVAQAFIDAKQRGLAVRLVTDSDNMVEKENSSKPRQAIMLLKAAGIPIVEDHRSAIMHHKFLVVDGQTVWMGSTNLTPRSFYEHNNNTLTIKSAEVAGQFHDEFVRLFEKHEFGSSSRKDYVPPAPVKLGDSTLQVFFSPKGGGRDAVVREVRSAKKSVKFLTFSLTDQDTGKTMLDDAKAGVKVQGVFDAWLAAGQYSLFSMFRAAKLNVWRDGNEALMHHKVIVIDDSTVITGSYNFSKNAENNNNEAFVIVHGAAGLASDYADEFSRVMQAAQHNHPPSPHHDDDHEVTTGDDP